MFSQCGHLQKALDVYKQMNNDHLTLTEITFICLFSGCAQERNWKIGEKLHEDFNSISELMGE